MAWPSKRSFLRYWRRFRIVAGFALIGVACWVIVGKSSELSGASAFLTNPRWEWLVLALVAETFAYLALAMLERRLLVAGQVPAPLRRITLIVLAGNAIQAALPVGAAFAGVYQFGQLQLVGADEVLAGWVVIATGVVSFSVLAALAGVGLAMAASTGTAFDLVEAIVGVLVLALLAVAVWTRRSQVFRWVNRTVPKVEKRLHRPAGHLSGPLGRGVQRMRSVAPSRAEWAKTIAAAAASWLCDCGCLAFASLAVGTGVPWQGLLLAYCGAQLAVLLPITPGGLGVVEGSLTVALVAFGGGRAATVAAVLLYRVISFWLPIPVGAGCYATLLRLGRREAHRRAEAAQATPVAASEHEEDLAGMKEALAGRQGGAPDSE